MLKRADKERVVSELADILREALAVVVASFRALPVRESAALRRALRPSGGRVRVVPKRLFRRVAEILGWPAALAETSHSIAVAWTEGPAKPRPFGRAGSGGADLLAPAKHMREFVKGGTDAAFLGGVLEGAILNAAEVERLALLPSPDILRGQFVSALAGPLRGMLGVFTSVLRGVPAVLQAKASAPASS